MSLRNKFIAWYYDEFTQDPLFVRMNETVEASPWHREKSVGIHTNMVVSEYISWADKEWTSTTLFGAIACAFHDTGKPAARVEKFKPERGKYNSFGGHEVISARIFEDFAMRNFSTFETRFGLTYQDLYVISFIIEHHMPYEQPADKVKQMAVTANLLGVTDIFVNHLTADTHGRIADDHKDKIRKVDAWIEDFHRIDNHHEVSLSQKFLLMPIGASGAGKSTLAKKIVPQYDATVFSRDQLYLEWYDSDYTEAVKKVFADPKFDSRMHAEFYKLVKTGVNIYLDNTNLSRKRRRPFIDFARKNGYAIRGYLMPITLQTLLDRQASRGDKNVPESAVRQQYNALQVPLYGEFDRIETVTNVGIY